MRPPACHVVPFAVFRPSIFQFNSTHASINFGSDTAPVDNGDEFGGGKAVELRLRPVRLSRLHVARDASYGEDGEAMPPSPPTRRGRLSRVWAGRRLSSRDTAPPSPDTANLRKVYCRTHEVQSLLRRVALLCHATK